jgi:hypothetical protein
MPELLTSRRSFLIGLGAVLMAAPAIVRAGSLMPVRAEPLLTIEKLLQLHIDDCARVMGENISRIIYGDRSLGPLHFNGIEVFFDSYAPRNTVYLLGGRRVSSVGL